MLIATFLKLNDIRLKKDIIATLHNDFSARVQTVSKNTTKTIIKLLMSSISYQVYQLF